MPGVESYLPFWRQLTAQQQRRLKEAAVLREAPAGTVLQGGASDCAGLFVVVHGQLRAFLLSEEGREITLYRLLERDICLLSASCMLHSIEFPVTVSAELLTTFYQIPTPVYAALMAESAAVANYTNELMAMRFSDVMWLLDQVLYKRLDSRLAAFLLEESSLCGSLTLHLTHEDIARHLGSAREVITRLLKYLQSEGLVTGSRGGVTIRDPEGLSALAAASLR